MFAPKGFIPENSFAELIGAEINLASADIVRVVVKRKIGVIGSAAGVRNAAIELKARKIGRAIAKNDCYLITGGCGGLPYEAANGAKAAGGTTIGISPGSSYEEHVERYNLPVEHYDLFIFTGMGFKGRNVPYVRTCDGIIAVSGRIGTLNEMTIALDEGRPLGVLKGSGGIADKLPGILADMGKEHAAVIYESDPEKLVKLLLKEIGKR